MAKYVKKTAAPFYFAAAVWLLWGLTLPLYRPAHYVLVTAVSVAAALTGRALFPDRTYETREEKPAAEPPKTSADPEIEALKAERDRALGELRRLNAAIEDEKISRQIDRLEADTGKIAAYVVEHPEKLPQIRKFLNYYLPTTLKLLNAYDRMDDAGISGENVDSTKSRVEGIMETIVTAFDRQLDALFGDEALDIATDITVLENLLAREGLTGAQSFAQSGGSAGATQNGKGEENDE